MLKSRTLFLLLALGLLAVWFFASRGRKNTDVPTSARPNDPWVFRSVLDKQPRMITFALDDQLWVAYSTDSCALYKAWSGSAAFEGAVYNMRHGPQPMSVGPAWFENTHKRPWVVKTAAGEETPRTDYRGHRYTKGGHAEIMYDLVLASGQRIRINEQPEMVNIDGQRGFQRTFAMSGAPDGAEVVLRANASSIADASSIETNGAWKTIDSKNLPPVADNLHAVAVDGELTLRRNASTTLTTMFISVPCIPNPFDAERKNEEEGEQTVSPGERLMAKSDCRTCHNAEVKTVGPGYAQIAQRYKNTPENIEKLAQKVMAGGAGVWGVAAMSAHPDLQPDDAKAMIAYVLSLDEGEDDGEGGLVTNLSDIPAGKWLSPEAVKEQDLTPGLRVKLFQLDKAPNTFADISFAGKPTLEGAMGQVEANYDGFGEFKNNFALQAEGYLYLEKDDNILLTLASDDGSRLFLDGQLLINHDGWHGSTPKEAEVALRAGYHPIRVEYFQAGGGRGLSLQWTRSGSPETKAIPIQNFAHMRGGDPAAMVLGGGSQAIPGDGVPLKDVHPAYDLSQARPEEFLPKVAGMDFLSDGRLVVSTWDAMGGVYILSNVSSGDPKKIKVKRIAKGLAEPLGLKVVDDTIFVLQKQELTKLVDTDGDDIIDEYQCFAKGWLASANFHEFAFGLAYKDGHFYAALATAILPGGASARPQILDRGKCVKISRQDGSIEFVARGLRTPDGVGLGANGEIFITDNQGDWLPSSKLLLVTPGAFFNSYSVDSVTVAQMPVTPPVVWLPQDEIGNSPTQPSYLKDGPYQGQVIFGDVCYGGLQRVSTETVNGVMQGCVFRFTQGLEGGTHRLAWGPDGALYVGMIGNPGNWGQEGKLWYGLQRMKYNGNSVFEMLAVRAKSNGMEIEFTEPLRDGDGWNLSHYLVKQWRYQPTFNYGGPKLDETTLDVKSATVSADGKKVFLEIPGLKAGHVVHIRLRNLPLSALNHEIWTTEAWYTLNEIPAGQAGEVSAAPAPAAPLPDNTLSEREKAEGWKLLFDGQSLNGWHNYGKTTIGAAWIVQDNAIHLDAKPRGEGEWQQKEGGDILTNESYKDFELELDWRIGPCGNSGIFYNVIEDPAKYGYGWMTGPEMQVLDNACHPDARIPKHRAGDLYDMIACKYETVRPAGEWNHVRIVSKNGKIEHWLNNRKLVTYDQNSPEWPKMIAASKFHEWAAFGTAREGKIALQDHGDPVWYKNIKIRRL